jgi:hypothetical protein
MSALWVLNKVTDGECGRIEEKKYEYDVGKMIEIGVGE